MKIKKLLYSGAVLGAVGIATIVPITINASTVNDTYEETLLEEEPDNNARAQCLSPSGVTNWCGYASTSSDNNARIIYSLDVIAISSNYARFSISTQSGSFFSTGIQGNFGFGFSNYNHTADPLSSGTNTIWMELWSNIFGPFTNLEFNYSFTQGYILETSGGSAAWVIDSPMQNVGKKLNPMIYFVEANSSGAGSSNPYNSTDWTMNSIFSGNSGSGKYFYIPGIMPGSAKLSFDESVGTFYFNYSFMPAIFFTGSNGQTSKDGGQYTEAPELMYFRLKNTNTGAYVFDSTFSNGTAIGYTNDPVGGASSKWFAIQTRANDESATPGTPYSKTLSIGGTSGFVYDNMLTPGTTYRLEYTSSSPYNSYSPGLGTNNWVEGAQWLSSSFVYESTPYPISTISTTFSLSDSDSNGIAEGFNINYSINAGSTSRYVYVKIQDQYQPTTIFTNDKFLANAGTSTGTITVQTNTPGFGNPSGHALYAGHTYSVCMSYKIPSANINCAATPVGGTTDIYKVSYTVPIFKTTPTTNVGRNYIDLTYDISFDSKQSAYNNFTYSVWDQTNGRWAVSNQVEDYNGKIGTPQTIRIALDSSTTYDIIINPSPWDSQVLNADGTVTDPYANNIIIQDVVTLDPMISTSNSIMTTGYSQLNWNYYLNYPAESITLNTSLYSAGQGPSTGATPLATNSIATNGNQTGNVQFDTQLYTLRGGTYEFYASVDETTGTKSELYHLQVTLDEGLESVDQNTVLLSGPTSATVNITWDSEQAGSIYYRTDFNNNGDFNDDEWFHTKDIAANSAGVHSITIDHLVSNKANQQVQLSMYPTGLNPTGVSAPNDIVTFTVPQTTSLGMENYRVSSTSTNNVQFQFVYNTQGINSYEYVSVYADGGGAPTGSAIYSGQMLIEANTNISTFWLSETTPYAGSTAWSDTLLTSQTTYWLVFSFDDPVGSGNKAKVKFTTD